MSTDSTAVTSEEHFVAGARCLVEVLGRRYLSTVLTASDDRLRLTFPTLDFPLDGMYVSVEFHDDHGFTTYESEVLAGPKEVGDGLVVKRPPQEYRSRHRGSWRVPGDFAVQLKGHVHPRRYEAPVVNISTGGLLVKTHAELDMGDNLDLHLMLPGAGEALELLGQVVHCATEERGADDARLLGVRFVSPDPGDVERIRGYIRGRIRALYPASSGLYGPKGGES